MNGDPIARVFALPELLSLIVRQFHESHGPKDLPKLALLSRNWLDPVMSIVWKSRRELGFLHEITPKHRQYYVDKIRVLRWEITKMPVDRLLEALEPCSNDGMKISFHKLQGLHFTLNGSIYPRDLVKPGHEPRDPTPVRCSQVSVDIWAPILLGPRLRDLTLCGEDVVTKELSVHLSELCPSVQHLEICVKESEEAISLLACTLKAFRLLQTLKLTSQHTMRNRTDELSLLSALLGNSKLEALHFESPSKFPILPTLTGLDRFGISGALFPRLKSLCGSTSVAKLGNLAAIMPALTTICLQVTASSVAQQHEQVLPSLIAIDGLDVVHLELHKNYKPGPEDLEALRHFKGLSSLSFAQKSEDWDMDYMWNPPRPGLADGILFQLGRNSPHLRDLTLGFSSAAPPTIKDLIDLGVNCRSLRTLNLHGRFDLSPLTRRLARRPPLFPALCDFSCRMLYYDEVRASQDVTSDVLQKMVAVLEDHFPAMSFFACFDDTDLEHRLDEVVCNDWDITVDPGPGEIDNEWF